MDKMDFAAALEPLQKYVEQRSEDPYGIFSAGIAIAGRQTFGRCENRIFPRDWSGSKMAART